MNLFVYFCFQISQIKCDRNISRTSALKYTSTIQYFIYICIYVYETSKTVLTVRRKMNIITMKGRERERERERDRKEKQVCSRFKMFYDE